MAVSASAHSRLEYDGGPPDPATWGSMYRYLGKANLMQKICKRGPQSSEIFEQKFQGNYHLGKFALLKILEGTLVPVLVQKHQSPIYN